MRTRRSNPPEHGGAAMLISLMPGALVRPAANDRGSLHCHHCIHLLTAAHGTLDDLAAYDSAGYVGECWHQHDVGTLRTGYLPFGGGGASGMGAYHGIEGSNA